MPRRQHSPRCEACHREPAMSFSWFVDPDRPYAPRSGTWQFTGLCTSDTERYYVLLHRRGYGWLDSAAERADWLRHLREKDWFDPLDFAAMLERFEAARSVEIGP
jgi:hypothetical protein